MPRAKYTIIHATPSLVALIDSKTGTSVTNDAEAVVADILARYGRTPRIFYQDTENRWAELKHNGSAFTDFSPIPSTEQAIIHFNPKIAARILNSHHSKTGGGFYGFNMGGRYFGARVQDGHLEVYDYETWRTVPADKVKFTDHNGREIPLDQAWQVQPPTAPALVHSTEGTPTNPQRPLL